MNEHEETEQPESQIPSEENDQTTNISLSTDKEEYLDTSPGEKSIDSPSEDSQFTRTANLLSRIREQVAKVFIGQDAVIDQVLSAMLTGGHVLMEGKPGLGKTHLILALAKTVNCNFSRIQFTPDLMPSDVTGHTLYDMGSQTFKLRKGPVFTNLLLADEINRAPAKTQAALLEVMQESQVTIDGETIKLEPPFIVFATQNPIEHEGTYPLPEAQLDRFLMKVLIDYPTAENELSIVENITSQSSNGLNVADIEPVCSPQEILDARHAVANLKAVPEVNQYALNIVRATRNTHGISLGAGTRGAISLILAAKSFALMSGRSFITPDDVKKAALPTLRHRIVQSPELAISGQNIDDTILTVVNTIDAPR